MYKRQDVEFKTLVLRMLEELREDLSSIKKIQSETKDLLIEIKNNLGETTVEWMKLRIKSMIWHIRRQKTTSNKKKKRIQKNEDSISSLWDNFKCSNIRIIGVPGEEKEQEIGNLSEKNNERKLT